MKNTKRFLLILMTACVLMVGCNRAVITEDKLFEGFRQPPSQARPFVRWWWNGNCVTEKEILRELDIMKDAGVGGVEINVIAMPPWSDKTQAKALTWLSDEWNHIIKATVDATRQRGMFADIIVGSGWPFGGKFLKSGETIQGVALNKKELQGPGVFNGHIKTLMVPPKAGWQGQNPSEPRLMFLKLVPSNASGTDYSIDMLEKVTPDGKVQFDIPAGSHTLYVGTWQEGFKDVVHGAPGADGPVLDHYNGSAVKKYLQRMSDSLAPALGGQLGDGFRAIFCDSIELSGANWTAGFAEQFEKRRGYELAPYLPFVLDEDDDKDNSQFAETIRRVRYDFYKTIVELFHENFVASFQQWCNQNGALSRFQSEGHPRVLEMLDGYLVTDIPEGEIWLDRHHPDMEMELDRIRYEVFNKYASSGAHLTGKRLVSSEAMTNVTAVFRATLEYIKQTSDLSFITGVNHLVLHGFNYSPPEAGFPGWVRYGTYFSEQNPWWPYFKKWADYNARLSWVFQQAEPQANVAIVGPTAEVWSWHGLMRAPLFITPWYLHLLWQAVHQNGYCADYVNPTVLEAATFDGGKLRFGPMAYDVLMVAGVGAMEPATADAIRRYSRAGGKIVFIGKSPDHCPGLANAAEKDKAVRTAISAALKSSPNVAVVAEPEKDNLLEWAGTTLKKFGVKPYLKISHPDQRLFQMHHRLGNRDLFFFANSNRDKPVAFRACFDTGKKTAWRWNPETGARTVFPYTDNKSELDIHLRPLESLLLVFEPDMDGKPQYETVIDYEDYVEIKMPWQVKLNPVAGEPFEREMAELADFAEIPELSTFAGTAVYRTEFNAADTKRTTLSLGKVCGVSELKLNGNSLGCRWYGEHIYDVTGALRPGKNVLEIKVATVLFNYCHSLKDNSTAQRWAGGGEPVSIGLIGPVRLLKAR
jgi:hypothetical protein